MEESFPVHDGGEFRHECVIERNGSLMDKCQVKIQKKQKTKCMKNGCQNLDQSGNEIVSSEMCRFDHRMCFVVNSWLFKIWIKCH